MYSESIYRDSMKVIPSLEEIRAERDRLKTRSKKKALLEKVLHALVAVAALAVVVSLLFFPILKVTGTSMEPNLNQGEVVVAVKTGNFATGDICSLNYNNSQLIKRVIASAGDWVDIDEEGNVWVNEVLLDEPYVQEKALGFNDLQYPYQVPEGTVFVMGDHRATSIDSRSSQLGPVFVEDVVGKVIFRIWPLGSISEVH